MEILKKDDVVKFRVGSLTLNYQVWNNHVSCTDGFSNYVVFDKLGLNDSQRKALATKHYGYKPIGHGDWPNFKGGDYRAATELVKAVHDLCNKHNFKLREDEKA